MSTHSVDRIDCIDPAIHTDRTDRNSASARKLAANRANAQKSTGPRTTEGKALACRNATSHGLFTDFCLMPGEDAQDYLAFRHGILASLHPTDPAQLLLADKVVSAQWRIKRLRLT